MTASSELLTIREVAERCRVTRQTVRDWHKAGRLAAIRLPGGRLRVEQAELDRILATLEEPEGA